MQHLVQHRNGYLILASGSILLNIMLFFSMFIVIGRERIVIVPPVVEKPLWVTSSQVSPDYLRDMSKYFSILRLNVTASNAVSQRDDLLRFVAPEHYNDIKTELLLEADKLKKNRISTAFFPINVDVDTKKMLARVTGDMHSTVGDIHLPIQHVTYEISYRYQSGRLIITSFDEVKSHA